MSKELKPLVEFITERHNMYIRKQTLEGNQIPERLQGYGEEALTGEKWTLEHLSHDEALRESRFGNVFYELDTMSTWITENVIDKYADHKNLWIMLAICRYVNWPHTLEYLLNSEGGWPIDDNWKPERIGELLEEHAANNERTYGGAYVIRTQTNPKKPGYALSKHNYIAKVAIGGMWENRAEWTRLLESEPTLYDVWKELKKPESLGWGEFLAYLLVKDLARTRYLSNSTDRTTWAYVGTGAIRCLNAINGHEPNHSVIQKSAVEQLLELRDDLPALLPDGFPVLQIADIERALCETEKWVKASISEVAPRARYVTGRKY